MCHVIVQIGALWEERIIQKELCSDKRAHVKREGRIDRLASALL